MQVIINEQGYVVSFATVGDLVDGMAVNEPEDMAHFESNFMAYMVAGSEVVFDEAKAEELAAASPEATQEERIADLEEALSLLLSGVTE